MAGSHTHQPATNHAHRNTVPPVSKGPIAHHPNLPSPSPYTYPACPTPSPPLRGSPTITTHIPTARLLAAAAVLLAALAISACSGNPAPTPTPTAAPLATATPPPTATPEPTPTRVPPPTPTPERDRLPLTLLRIDSATTGADLLTHLSTGEDSCFKSMMGGSKFEVFEGSLLMEAAADPSFKTRLVVCLQRDSLIVIGTRLMGAHLGGWVQETRECATAVAFNNPELLFQALGAPDVGAEPSDSDESRGVLLDLYECLDAAEQVGFTVSLMSNALAASPFTGQHFLDSLPESEVECLQANLPAPVFAMIAEMPSVAGGELRDAPPELLACISAESLGRIPAEILILGMGATGEQSRACLVDFVSTHGRFIELVQTDAEYAGIPSPEDSQVMAEGGSMLFACLTDEELAQFQEDYAPSMIP